jgi:hypothetical protein
VCCMTDGELGMAVGSDVCSLLCMSDVLWAVCVKSKMLAGQKNTAHTPSLLHLLPLVSNGEGPKSAAHR